MKKSIFLAAALICTSVPAFAQTQSGTHTGGYLAGIGGMTFGTETSTVFGGEVGVDATRDLTVYGSAGRMQNITPNYINPLLDLVGADLKVKTPATLVMGGVKYHIPSSSSVRPYVLGGAGFGSARMHVTDRAVGDVTKFVLDDSDAKATSLVLETGGGVEVPVGPMYLDAGYRYGRFVNQPNGLKQDPSQNEGANVSRAYVGVGYRFGGTAATK